MRNLKIQHLTNIYIAVVSLRVLSRAIAKCSSGEFKSETHESRKISRE